MPQTPIAMFPVLRGHRNIFLSPEGVLYGTFKGASDGGTWHDIGRWHITPDGHFCSRWHAWDSRRERCDTVYREGETFEPYVKDRLGKEVYRRVPGNPEGY